MAVKDSYRADHDPRDPNDQLVQSEAEPPFSWRAALEIIQALALAVIISVVLNLFVVQVTEVRQRSMESTLLQGDRVLVSKVDYRLGLPERGDIVVFQPTTDSTIFDSETSCSCVAPVLKKSRNRRTTSAARVASLPSF